ncbi:phage holin family protein [Paractinoplanes atraurantiacus]|uniref:4 TMS phage holin, superfamily IV n=1 Tax=Paractinoplanes atraurantiacus TaxID=1036182 RepID=A0A285J104_9ACTN|nr:phage holin family protein [Actinoplanes atraurantiacus]SNY53046.1 4 TMS phage holin, superfamily IV [Actinoplanes atraurantiacus]
MGAVARAVAVVALGWAAAGITVAVLPGISADGADDVLVVAIVVGLLGAVLRPALAGLLTWIGWAGVVIGWLVCQALIVYAALVLSPGIHVDGFWPAFWAAWIGAALMSLGLWVVTAGQPGVVTRHLIRAHRRYRRDVTRTDTPGLVIIQIDGLSAPLARWAVEAGNLPTLSRWLRAGHTLTEWHAQLPATTPASQAGLLHGASDQVPAFRWYEKEPGRLIVTNRPADAALVEQRCTEGLLTDGGVSISNVFSGGAPTSLLTMSTVRSGRGPDRYVSAYLLDPFGLTRSLVLTIGEIVKELYQARRRRLRGVEPRIGRDWGYVLLRGATNVLLRHLNLALIAEHVMRGAPAVYCDFVDYDEIAHHAGPFRPEALASLEGIDAVLATLEEVAAAAPRPYEFVVLSDHGQSQGATFAQRYGLRFEDLVGQLTTPDAVVAPEEDEQEGRARVLRAGLTPGPPHKDEPDIGRPEIVVAASGNLALIYLARLPGRVSLEEIEERHPKLIDGLVAHPGVGWVMARSRRDGPVVIGRGGRRLLDGDRVEGADPLDGFGPHAADDLRRHDGLAHTGDLLVNSLWDAGTQEVAAFEELIGCHGGLGGWQDRPLLIHPREWPVPTVLIGADAVHRLLRHRLDEKEAPCAAGSPTPEHPSASTRSSTRPSTP